MPRNASQGRDLLIFLDVAQKLQEGATSIGDIASAMKLPQATIPKSTLHDAVVRLNSLFPEKIFKVGGNSLKLTQFGLQVHDDLTRALENCGGQDRIAQLRLTASQALVTTGLLSTAIRDFIRKRGRRVRFDIKLQASFDIGRIMADLRLETLDLAFVWGTKDRLEQLKSNRVQFDEIPTKFDVVVISHSKRLISVIDKSLSGSNGSQQKKEDVLEVLANSIVVTLGGEAQVSRQLIPFANPLMGGRRIEVDTVEAAIACVRSRLADAAVIPAVYSDLNRYRQCGQLEFTAPVDSVCVIVLRSAAAMTPIVSEFVQDVKALFRITEESSSRSQFGLSSKFPIDPQWYEAIKFGYYIGADVDTDDGEFSWCWENINLNLQRVEKDKVFLNGHIKNQFETEFKICEAVASKEAFSVWSEQTKTGSNRTNCSEFVTVFTTCWEDRGIVSGTWSGRDRDKNAGIFGSIWSHKRLGVEDLRVLSQQSSMHSILSAETGVRFDEHLD